MSEQIRDGFESWCKTLGFNIDKFDEDYIIASTEWAWKIWQASRAALVVELPGEVVCERVEYYYDGWNDAAAEARLALDEAGIKHK